MPRTRRTLERNCNRELLSCEPWLHQPEARHDQYQRAPGNGRQLLAEKQHTPSNSCKCLGIGYLACEHRAGYGHEVQRQRDC